MMSQRALTYSLIAVLAFVFCGAPECMHALAQEPAAQEPSAQQQNQQQGQQPGVTVDPSKGPLSPVPFTEPVPSATQPEKVPASPTPQTIFQQQPGQQEPLGAATAGSVRTEGGLASRPAGNAIAPAKQHQVRSFLIKMGAIAAAGVAIGTVYALSKGTSSVPPNSGR